MNSSRRASVVIIVLWSVAVAAIVTSSVQLFAFRQATLGREAVDRVQARWAARGGVEQMMAIMRYHTERPVPDDAKAMAHDMFAHAAGDTVDAVYVVAHNIDERTLGGPMDEHSKINVNNSTDRGLLMLLDDMTLDVLDAIGDWMDDDDDVSTMGVERDYYLSLETPYNPRNGALRSIAELELIAGIWPKYFRGEDWNLNNRLDHNENDGSRTFPPDEDDGVLDAAWSGKLTVYSVAGGATSSGLPRIHLKNAEPKELVERLGISDAQAESLIQFGQSSSNSLVSLLFAQTSSNADSEQSSNPSTPTRNVATPSNQTAGAYTDEQLRLILAETTVRNPHDRVPGKLNINTVPADLFREILEQTSIDEGIIDEIIFFRDSRPEGIASFLDLKEIQNIDSNILRTIVDRFDTVSNVFTISSLGRSLDSGLEIEIVAVVDRSTVPVKILEYREQ